MDLQNATHPDLISVTTDSHTNSEIKTLDTCVAHVERAMVKMKAQTQRLHEYVDEAVDAVDQSVKRCERHEERVREVAEGLQGMKRAPSLPAPLNPTTAIAPPRTLFSRLVAPKTWFTPRPKPKNRGSLSFPVDSTRSSTFSKSTVVQCGSVSEDKEQETMAVPGGRGSCSPQGPY